MSDLCNRVDLVRVGYADGVPMGGTLPERPDAGGGPTFVVWAQNDLGTPEHRGALLQQVQIIKGWLDAEGDTHEKVFAVAGNPNNGARVDTTSCERSGPGDEELCSVWTDPDHVPGERAFYYARVLENPSCRFTAYDCARLPADSRPDSCIDDTIPLTIQARAWTSPIWTD
jgi:hypothetical protein